MMNHGIGWCRAISTAGLHSDPIASRRVDCAGEREGGRGGGEKNGVEESGVGEEWRGVEEEWKGSGRGVKEKGRSEG
jgi:hypothetical protein